MRVYYVTATHLNAHIRREVQPKPQHGPEDRVRTDLAKFFDRANADQHARDLHDSWKLVRVEERDETQDEQHYAHGGKVGAPAR